MKLFKCHKYFLICLFLYCFNRCVYCKPNKKSNKISSDNYEYLNRIDESYFNNEPLDDSDDYESDDEDNIFVRRPVSKLRDSSRGTKSKPSKAKKKQNSDSESNSNRSNRTAIVIVSIILSSIFISSMVGLGIWYKKNEAKKASKLVNNENVAVEIV